MASLRKIASRIAPRRVARRLRRVVAWIVAPRVRAAASIASGVAVALVGVAQWSPPLAVVLGGLALVFYGAVAVDLDAPGWRPRRGPR